MKKKMILLFGTVFLLSFLCFFGFSYIGGAITSTNSQSLFNEGNYSYTFYNTSGFLQLNASNISGNYTSHVFSIGNFYWSTVSWLSNTIELPSRSDPTINMTGNILLMHFNEQDNTIIDSSILSQNGMAYGATFSAGGKLNASRNFDGINDYVSFPALSMGSNYSISMWIKTNISNAGTVIGVNVTSTISTFNLSSQSPLFNISGESGLPGLGYDVVSGDVNGDGLNDTITSGSGYVYVLFASNNYPSDFYLNNMSDNWTIYGLTGVSFGNRLDIGDINNDGIGDIVVSAYNADSNGGADAGKVYVFFGSSNPSDIDLNHGENANITIGGKAAGDEMGRAISVIDVNNDGYDDIITGSLYQDPPAGADAGEVYVSFGTPGEYTLDLSTQSPNITIQGNFSGVAPDYIGEVLSSGDINDDGYGDIIISARASSIDARMFCGKIYTIYGTPIGFNFSLTNKSANITVWGKSIADQIGLDTASGDINNDGHDDIIIGAEYVNPAIGADAGEVYVIFGTDGDQDIDLDAVTANITISGEAAGYRVGSSVYSGNFNGDNYDDLLIGARFADPGARANAGQVYAIFGAPDEFDVDLSTQNANITLYGNLSEDYFGQDVASGDVNYDGYDDIIIGSFLSGDGNAFLIYGGLNEFQKDFNIERPNMTIYSDSGYSYASWDLTSGDINGDGIKDIVITAKGAIYTIFGVHKSDKQDLLLSTEKANWTIYGLSTEFFGYSAATGDINNDSYDDIIVGANEASVSGMKDVGKVYIIFGSSSPKGVNISTGDVPNATIRGVMTDDSFGTAVASGDINGDGYDDVIMSAPYADSSGGNETGKVYVVFGRPSGFDINLSTQAANITLSGDDPEEHMGLAVASGDFDGDGYYDIAVGAPGASEWKRSVCGKTYVFAGRADEFNIDLNLQNSNITIIGAAFYDGVGRSVAMGDINNDGYDDLATSGDTVDSHGETGVGQAYVIYGGPFSRTVDLSSSSANITLTGNESGDRFGNKIAIGNVNNDPFYDIIVSSPYADSSGISTSGEVYAFFGTSGGYSMNLRYNPANITIYGKRSLDYLGSSLVVADVNNNSYEDIIFGSWVDNPGKTYAIDPYSNVSESIRIEIVDGNVTAFVDSNFTLNSSSTITRVNDSQWHHIVFVENSTANYVRLYLDGVEEGNASFPKSSIWQKKILFWVPFFRHTTTIVPAFLMAA